MKRLRRWALLGWPAMLLALASPAVRAEGFAVSEFSLDNGLRLVVIPDRRAPVVTHMVWYRIGSADEDAGKSGIAHFFEHLMFKGTSTHGPGVFSAAVAAVGGEENAFTSYDYTAYYQEVAPSALAEMMAFESDRMRNLVLTDEVIVPERDVILEERRMRVDNRPEAVLDEELDATLYQNHPYRIPVIGWNQEIEQLNRADAVSFYERYYAPNNAIVVVAGDVDPDAVLAEAKATYGRLAKGPDLPPRTRPREPEQNTARTVTLADPRVSLPMFRTLWVTPSYRTDKGGEGEALDLLAEILGGNIRSRLYQQLVVKDGIATSVGAYYQGEGLDYGTFGLYGAPAAGTGIADVEAAVRRQVEKLASEGVTEAELAAAKKRFVRSTIFARDDQSSMARIYGATLAVGGTVEEIETWPDRIEAVTADEVKAAANAWLDYAKSTTGTLLPAPEGSK